MAPAAWNWRASDLVGRERPPSVRIPGSGLPVDVLRSVSLPGAGGGTRTLSGSCRQWGALCTESERLLETTGPVRTCGALSRRPRGQGGPPRDRLPSAVAGRWTGFRWPASSFCCFWPLSSYTTSSWHVTSTAAPSLPPWWTSPPGALISQTSGPRRRP